VRIALGADHAGFELKQRLTELLASEGHWVADLGTHSL
jgi:ribose 5-phosphate isomerase RpiB